MKVITISRDYGAGGHSIGTKVAETLGIEFYDRDIIKETALEMGMDPGMLEADEERITKGDSFLRAITPISFDYKDSIFNYERNIIVKIASEGPCVILGRCAGDILQKEGIDCLNVYLYADQVHCAKRVGELLGTQDLNVIAKEMKKRNAARNSYFTYYTGKHLADARNWHMVLDTGILGYETCVKLICDAALA
ncbi:MAG: cytidylate kinase-like family protein [Parasporobacterium sp.]|nr:cytidylate kinase-like family protein [Parasporobacterium sp.]